MSPRPSSSSFVIPTIFGAWSTMSEDRDLEAQLVVGTHEQLPGARLPTLHTAYTHTSRAISSPVATSAVGTDPVNDFFGIVPTSRAPGVLCGTHDIRHDEVRVSPLVRDDDAPPPYSYSSDPPAYSRAGEYPTLAMYLFKFGFLFPLFWIAGAFILISPLRAPDDWELSKTEAERQELLETMRLTEVKWAKRCLVAFAVLTVVILVIVLSTVFALRS